MEAEPLYRAILKKAPKHFDALHMLGVLHLQTGRNEDAFKLITRAVAAKPGAAAALNNQGNALQTLGRLEEALVSYDRALVADPTYAEAFKNRGDVLRSLQRHEEALTSYDSALQLNPQHADALNNRGATLQILERIDEALRDYEKALAIKPANPLALNNRGDALILLERPEDALASYRQALAVAPGSPEAMANIAKALRGLKRWDEAIAESDKAFAIAPDNIKVLNSRGAILRDMQRPAEAIACFDRVIAMQPDCLEAFANRGTTFHEIGRTDDALADFNRALSINPAHAETRWNRALTLLMTEQFSEGWRDFEWRLKNRSVASRPRLYPQPRWQGEDLAGKSLLIWGEQGIGDEILYAGMVDDLLTRGLSLVWVADARLHPLIKRRYPGLRVVAHETPPAPITQDASIGAQISTPYLGKLLRSDAARFPTARRGYLKADSTRAKEYRARLLGDTGKRLIGVSWISRNPRFGTQKSIRLADLAPFWDRAGADTRFVDLQYGDTAAERAAAPFGIAHLEDVDLFNDLDGVGALITACDLVITISNSTAHLAGSLDIPVWVVIPTGHGKLWYWGADRPTSLWYPSAAIFRQRTPGDWNEVIASIAGRLADTA
ncbi:MAG: tetratricopeptide repeat protein [Rhodospirillaceae bacterium]|nr:tetratricopeptide repeat protein [Rhodospirillaceae bacterium]